jgi:hypothetical protein
VNSPSTCSSMLDSNEDIMKIKNKRTYALEIAATGQVVNPGDSVEVDAPLAKRLLEQSDTWGKATATKKTNKSEED